MLEVRSEPGHGTTVTMLLPLTLALMRVLVFRRGEETFGLPLTSVDEAITVNDTLSLGGQERPSTYEGGRWPWWISPRCSAAPPSEPGRNLHAMIVASSDRRVALLCDRIVEEQEVVIKTLGPLLAGVPGYLGAAIVAEGRIALILDPARHEGGGTPAPTETSRTRARRPTVLVVDDQFTVRELQRSILESAGYDVKTARDGREALSTINSDPGSDWS